MSGALERAIAFVQQPGIEGGYSNVKEDRGGSTMHGITQRLYDAWRITTGQPKRDVRLMTADEIFQISRDEFWTPCGCDLLPDDLAVAVFDMAFNSSPWNAKRTLQKALGVAVDGVIGLETLKAARETPDGVQRFLIARGAFIQEVLLTRADQVIFLEGWIKRLVLLAYESSRA